MLIKSINEELNDLCDVYDSLIAPKKIYRDNNNKIFLILKAFAAGKISLNDTGLALYNKFNPAYCSDEDLLSIAKLVGTELKQGSFSQLDIIITNVSEGAEELPAGVYEYRSIDNNVFSFEIESPMEIDAGMSEIKTAISREKGIYPVSGNSNIKLQRSDGVSINNVFKFSCNDNSNRLGYPDEDLWSFRNRILKDSERQDAFKELETRIRNLPNIFECDIVFNEDTSTQFYDGILLQPKEILLTITGYVTNEVADEVCKSVIYDTHMCDPTLVLYYYNDLYVSGKKAVYYREHGHTNFSMVVTYRFDSTKIKVAQVENEIRRLFNPYRDMRTRIDIFGEFEAYKTLEEINITTVRILDIDICDSNGQEVSFIEVPKTRLLNLTNITFISHDIQLTQDGLE